jgi:predicted GTPase
MKSNCYDRLAHAANEAVEASLEEMSKVLSRVKCLTDLFQATAEEVRSNQKSNETCPSNEFAAVLNGSCDRVRDLFKRQQVALKTFNIVFFGRTGAGKSSLISAISRSNGSSVSQGESDWTTDVEPVPWHSCNLYDTPGINGWGRTKSREDLEEKARKAVEVSDLVIVCFDSQSQQAEEFAKLSAWVQTYRKPVIAVLNPRNAVWRMPCRVAVGTARANLSKAVSEHAGNIRDELAKIGLTGVPVVALSSKRALFARATLPFHGPDAQSLQSQRNQFTIESLESWSDYPRLEGLMVKVVSDYATQIRIGALNDQVRGVFRELSENLCVIREQAESAATTLESDVISPRLKLLGYPPENSHSRRLPFMDGDCDLLKALEQMRGGSFQAPVDGEFLQLVTQRLGAKIGTLRSRSLQKSEELLLSAFETGRDVSGEEMKTASFNEPEIQKVAQAVLKEGAEFLVKRVELSQHDAILDLKILGAGSDVKGSAGKGWKYSSWAMKSGGILLGAAGALGGFAFANIWNPAGWTAAVASGIALVGALGAMLFGWLGGKARKKAEEDRLTARRKALAELRRNIHEIYDKVVEDVLGRAQSFALEATTEILRNPIQKALSLRTVQHRCASLSLEIEKLSSELPVNISPQSLVWDAATSLEREAYPDRPNAASQHWLGEDWIDDPEGLQQPRGTTGGGRTTAYDPSVFDRMFAGIQGIFDRVTDHISPGSGKGWLKSVIQRFSADEEVLAVMSELRRIADDGRPRIHLVGDYNSGKTSFIKRLLVDAGIPLDEKLEVRANPTTETVKEYEWDDIILLDSPGFQSGEDGHTASAMNSIPDASAVIYLFQPNLILGNDEGLIAVLRGDPLLGIVPKKDRTFFIVNRADELGVDPEDDSEAYRKLAERKTVELSLALASRNITVDQSSILCMASDPYGLVGNRTDADSSAYDLHRDWDGMTHFVKTFRRAKKRLLRTGCDRSILEGGIARMTRLQATQKAALNVLRSQNQATSRLQAQINEAIAEGIRLGSKHRADLERLLSDETSALRDEVLAERDATRLKVKADNLAQWWKDEAIIIEVKRWTTTASTALNEWNDRTSEAISRRLNSVEFRNAFCEHTEDSLNARIAPKGENIPGRIVGKIGGTLSNVTRDIAYSVGKALKVKFKPWGAVKLAKTLGKAGAILSVLGVTWDIAEFFLEEHRQATREKERKRLADFLQSSVPRVVETIAFGDDETTGILRTLDTAIKQLKKYESDLQNQRNDLAAQVFEGKDRLGNLAELKEQAIHALGNQQ